MVLLKDLEVCIRNFIWSGDITRRKLVTIAWKKVCKPYVQGGLGIRSIIHLNSVANLKLCWNMLHKKESWSKLLYNRVIRNNKVINHQSFLLYGQV
jgi:hypothetical protein